MLLREDSWKPGGWGWCRSCFLRLLIVWVEVNFDGVWVFGVGGIAVGD